MSYTGLPPFSFYLNLQLYFFRGFFFFASLGGYNSESCRSKRSHGCENKKEIKKLFLFFFSLLKLLWKRQYSVGNELPGTVSNVLVTAPFHCPHETRNNFMASPLLYNPRLYLCFWKTPGSPYKFTLNALQQEWICVCHEWDFQRRSVVATPRVSLLLCPGLGSRPVDAHRNKYTKRIHLENNGWHLFKLCITLSK